MEFERVQELIVCRIPPHSHVLDVGGATGVHAAPLAELGHDVVLIDPVPTQVQEAKRHGTFDAQVGDARERPHLLIPSPRNLASSTSTGHDRLDLVFGAILRFAA